MTHFSRSRPRFFTAAAVAIGLWAGAAAKVSAGPYVHLGVVDGLGFGFPEVVVQIQGPGGSPTYGPTSPDNIFLLDTGSNFVTVVGDAVSQLTGNGYQTVATYNAPGLGGNHPTQVSQPYQVRVTDSNAAQITLDSVRLLSSTDNNSDFYGNRLGMPALLNRVTTIDFLGGYQIVDENVTPNGWPVRFGTTPLPNAAGRYHLPIELFELPLSGQINSNDPLPTSARVPVIEATLQLNGRSRTGRFMIDTTKEATSVSHDFALEMGFDTNANGNLEDEDNVGSLEFNRLGGTQTVTAFAGDRIRLITDEGVDLVWDSMVVGVYEPPAGIDGIIGLELFSSGWYGLVEPNPDIPPESRPTAGYIDRMHFDLTASDTGFGQLVVDVNPQFHQLVSPPPYQNDDDTYDVNGDGDVQPLDVLVLINYLNSTTSPELPMPDPGEVVQAPFLDVSGDNIASPLDVLQVINFLNAQQAQRLAAQSLQTRPVLSAQSLVAVPEPSSIAMLFTGGLAMVGLIYRRIRPVRT